MGKRLDEGAAYNRLAAVGIGGNVVLAAFKLAAGILGNSGAMVSDAVHSLSDVFATLVAYVGVRLSRREADAGHPYGHERFECVASLLLGCILVVAGAGIGWVGVEKIVGGSAGGELAVPGTIALVAAGVSIVAKEAMFWYTRHWARRLNSSAFMADAWHHRSDALSSVGALAGIGAAMLGFPLGDPIASIVICLLILKVALDIFKDATDKLLDTPCSPELQQRARACIEGVPGVVRIEQMSTRRFGNKVYIEADIAVDGGLAVSAAHVIAQAAHGEVERSLPEVKHIVVRCVPDEAPAG